MTNHKAYSLQDLDTLRQAAKAVCPSSGNGNALSDLALHSTAAELLEISIPELPPALAKLGLSSTTLDTNSKPSSASTLQRTELAQSYSLLDLEHVSNDSVLQSHPINLNDDDALLHPYLKQPMEPGVLGQIKLGLDASDGHDPEAIGEIDWTDYFRGPGYFLPEDPLDPAFWLLDCDEAWLPSTLHTGTPSNHDAELPTSDPPGLLAGPVSSSTTFDFRETPSSDLLRSSDASFGLGKPRTRPIASTSATHNTNPSRASKPQTTMRGPILDARVRKEISDTRQRKTCVRCRMQQLKVGGDLMIPAI